MTDREWLASEDPARMLDHLKALHVNRTKRGRRKLRLVAVGFCRHDWEQLGDEPGRRAVEVAERFADGVATEEQRHQWHWAAYYASESRWDEDDLTRAALAHAVNCSVHHSAAYGARHVSAGWGVGDCDAARHAAATHCDVIRDVFGPLYVHFSVFCHTDCG